MDLQDAKNLAIGEVIYHNVYTNADGSPQRWRVNGMVKTWKTVPNQVKVPIKHGLWDYDYLTDENMGMFRLEEIDDLLNED